MARRPGRPSKFDPKFAEQATKLCALGATDREVADFFEVTEATLNTWKHQHPEFLEALKLGKEPADQRVEQSLYRKACGYTQDDLHFSAYEGEVTATPYVKHVPPDTTACIFWLKNRRPDLWRERVEMTGKDGKDLVPIDPYSIETARKIAFVLDRAARQQPTQH